MAEEENTKNQANAETINLQESCPIEQVPFETSIPLLKENFFFHEIIKGNSKTKHYIIEDIMVDPETLIDPDAPLFYYLKQRRYTSKTRFLEAKKYYTKFIEYCKSSFSKNDIIKLHYIFDFEDKKKGFFEIVTVFDYGEADRIDRENISDPHINKFLKNVCLLLKELKDFNGIYNGNLSMNNIVLSEGELKMSGFKPIYAPKGHKTKKWKNELAKKYGVYRLDLFLLGVLWLNFLKVDFGGKLSSNRSLRVVIKEVEKKVSELSQTRKMDIINKLISLEKYPKLNLEEVVLFFDEYYVLENMKITKESRINLTSSKTFRTLEESRRDGKTLIESKSKNIFKKSLIDSELFLLQSKLEDQMTAKMFNSNTKNMQGNGITFTLKERQSELDESGGKMLMDEAIDKTFDFSKANKEAVIEDINKQLNRKKSISDENRAYNSLRSNSGSIDSTLEEEEEKDIKAKIAKANRRKSGPAPKLSKLNFKGKDDENKNNKKDQIKDNKEMKIKDFKEKQKNVLKNTEMKRFSFGVQDFDPSQISVLSNNILSKRDTVSGAVKKDPVNKSIRMKHETIEEVEENSFVIDSAFYEKTKERELKEFKEKELQEKKERELKEKKEKELKEKERKELEELKRDSKYRMKEIEEIEKKRKKASILDDLKKSRRERRSDSKNVVWKKRDNSIVIEVGSDTSEEEDKEKPIENKKEDKKETQIKIANIKKNSLKRSVPMEELKIKVLVEDKQKEEDKETGKDIPKKDKTSTRKKSLSNEKIPKGKRSISNNKTHIRKKSISNEGTTTGKKSLSKEKKSIAKTNTLKKNKQTPKQLESKKRLTNKRNSKTKKSIANKIRSKSVIRQNKKRDSIRKNSVKSNERGSSNGSDTKNTRTRHNTIRNKSRFCNEKIKAIYKLGSDNNKLIELQKSSPRAKRKIDLINKKKNKEETLKLSNHKTTNNEQLSDKKEESKTSRKRNKLGLNKKVNINRPTTHIKKKLAREIKKRNTISGTKSFKVNETQVNQPKNDNEAMSFTNKSFTGTLSVTSNNSKLSETDYMKIKQPLNSPTAGDGQRPNKKDDIFTYNTEAKNTITSRTDMKINNSLRKKSSLQIESKMTKEGVSLGNLSKFAIYNNSIRDSEHEIGRGNNKRIINSKTSFSRFKIASNKLTHVTTNVTENTVEKKSVLSKLVNDKDKDPDKMIEDSKVDIEKKNFEEANKQLIIVLSWLDSRPLKKAEVLCLIGQNYFELKENDNSIKHNKDCIAHINKQESSSEYDDILKLALMGLAYGYLEKTDYKEAEETLKDDIFEKSKIFPDSYFELLGDIYFGQSSFINAYNSYRKEFNLIRKKNMEGMSSEDLVKFIEKMFFCLEKSQRESEMKSLHTQVLGLINKLPNEQSSSKDKEQELKLREMYFFHSMLLFLQIKNFKMTIFMLEEFEKDKKCNFSKLKNKERLQLVDIYIELINNLKSHQLSQDDRLLYCDLLNKSKSLIEKCDESQLKLQKELFINFNLGLYYLKENQFKEAKNNFKRSLKVYDKHTTKPNEERISLYCNIAISLYHLGNYKECVYYFEQIKETGNKDKVRSHQSAKMLAKTYYRIGEYDKCRDTLQKEVTSYIEKKDNEGGNFNFYLFLYFAVCSKTKQNSFDKLLNILRKQLDSNNTIEDIFTFNILFNFSNLSTENSNVSKNKELLFKVKGILKKENDKNFPSLLLGIIDRITLKYIFNKREEDFKEQDSIIQMLYDKKKDIQQNCQVTIDYYINILFTFLNVVPFGPGGEINYSERNELLNRVKRFKERKQIYRYIIDSSKKRRKEKEEKNLVSFKMNILDKEPADLERNISDQKVNNIALKPSRHQKRKSIRAALKLSKQLKHLRKKSLDGKEKKRVSRNSSSNKGKDNRGRSKSAKIVSKRVKRLNSDKFLKQSNLEKINKCICSSRRIKGNNIYEHIDSFLRQLKNMFSLGITDGIENYYNKFEGLIKDKRLKWEKYIYVKKLCQFYFANKNQKAFRKDRFNSLMDVLLQTPDLCIHDIGMMIVLLESFKDISYVESFVLYLDKFYEDILKVIVKDVILLNFDKKYKEIKEFLFSKIQDKNYYNIENFPFIHYLDKQKELTLQKDFTFKIYKRIRYTVLGDLKWNKVFSKYIKEQELAHYYLKYATYTALVDNIRKDIPSLKIMMDYRNRLEELFSLQKDHYTTPRFFPFDYLLLISLLKLNEDNNQQTADIIISVLQKLTNNKTNDSFYCNALVSSKIGNVLFRSRLFKHSIMAKTLSWEILKNKTVSKVTIPEYIREISVAQLLFGVLVYLFMAETILNNNKQAERLLTDIEKVPIEDKRDKLELTFINIIHLMTKEEYKKVEKIIQQFKQDILSSKVNSSSSDMYLATAEKILLEVETLRNNKTRIEKQNTKTNGMVGKLANSLAKIK